MSAPTPDRRIASSAVVLIAATICAGIAACVLGAVKWGIWGASVGLVGTWAVFLLGLFGLYRRHRPAEQTGHLTTHVDEAPRTVGHPDGY